MTEKAVAAGATAGTMQKHDGMPVVQIESASAVRAEGTASSLGTVICPEAVETGKHQDTAAKIPYGSTMVEVVQMGAEARAKALCEKADVVAGAPATLMVEAEALKRMTASVLHLMEECAVEEVHIRHELKEEAAARRVRSSDDTDRHPRGSES